MAVLQIPWTTQTTGIAASIGAFDQTDLLRIPYVASEMPYLNNGSAVFWKLLGMLPMGEAVDQPRFEFFTDTKFETQVKGTSILDAVETALLVDDYLILANMALYNQRTEEIVYVTAVSGLTCTVERGWAGTTAAATAVDDVWIILATNLPEGADANDGVVKLPTKDYNYITFFSETISETDVQKMTNMRNNIGKIKSSYTDTYAKLIEQMDNTLRYGVRFAEERSEGTVYSTGGFKSTVGNVIDIANGADYQALNTAFNAVFAHTSSSPVKFMLAGQGVHDKLIALQTTREPVTPPSFNPEIGAMVTRIRLSGGGVIDLVLDKHGFSSARNMADDYFLIDPAHIRQRPFNGFTSIVSRDVTAPGSHTYKDELYGSVGVEIVFPDDVHAHGTFLSS
jgi:hypothetical protein